MFPDIQIEKISFSECRDYWLEVDHFQDPQKNILEYVETLGSYKTTLKDPKRQAYGLRHDGHLIGVTQLVQWSENWLRYRTINIRNEYRGDGLGWYLLKSAYESEWSNVPFLFGWTKKSHVDWALKNDFTFINDDWQDEHIGMLKDMRN